MAFQQYWRNTEFQEFWKCSSRRDCPNPEPRGHGKLVVLLCNNKATSQNKRRINRNTCFKGHKNKRLLYGTTEAPFHMDWSFTVGLANVSEDVASSMMHEVLTRAPPYIGCQVTPPPLFFIPALTARLFYPDYFFCIGGVLTFQTISFLKISSDQRDEELLDKDQ